MAMVAVRSSVCLLLLLAGWVASLVPQMARAAPAAPSGRPGPDGALRVAGHQYQLTVPGGWTAVPAGQAAANGPVADRPVLLAGYRHGDSGARAVIVRTNYPNPGAWRQRPAFFEQVEAGLQASTLGYTRLYRRPMRLAVQHVRVPAMDLGFRRHTGDGTEVVHMRFLFFRRYTLALALAAPASTHRHHRRSLRALVDGFVPYLGS